MAFLINDFDSDGVSSNTNAPGKWKYTSSTDALATVSASGYFDLIAPQLKINDLMYIVASDDAQFLKITAVTPAVTTIQFSESVDAGSITLAKLAPGITPSHIAVVSNEQTTLGGGATEVFTMTGALLTDSLITTIKTAGAIPVSILSSTITAGQTATIVFSADPSTDHVVTFLVMRAAT